MVVDFIIQTGAKTWNKKSKITNAISKLLDHLKILFTFHNDEREKDYYFLYQEGDEDSLFCLSTKDGVSFEYLSEEEADEAEQVLDAYNDDPMIQDLKKEA